MEPYKEQLRNILTELNELAAFYTDVINNSPDGCLIAQKSRGKTQFLSFRIEDGRRVRKGITKDENMLRALGHKEFAKVALNAVESNAEVIKKALDRLRSLEPEDLCQMLRRPYLQLPQDYLFDREFLATKAHLNYEDQIRIERHRGWGTKPFKQSTAFEENKTIKTSAGFYVRSKNEALIVETLLKYGIEFHYDQEFELCGEIIVPDFTFEGEDGQVFFWEYMGMMNHPDYAQHCLRKLQLYNHAGFVPGGRLIVTFSYGGGIDMEMIDTVIRNEVIPRL